jgi:outer membrane immunogenic protein
MQKTLVAASFAALLGMGASASAADIYSGGSLKDGPVYAPVNTWTGFYFGANGGYGWDANGDQKISVGGNIPFGPGLPFSRSVAGTSADGGFGGAQAGYNWQRGPIVFGVETDIQISDIGDEVNGTTRLFGPLNLNTTTTTALDWFGTVRGRIGYAWDNTLLYFTGGFAYGKVEDSLNATLSLGGPSLQFAHLGKNDIETGYVLGGGLEFKPGPVLGLLNGPNWTVKLEYQYINLGSEKVTGSVLGLLPLQSSEIDHEYHTVRVGLNYHIPNGYEPLK